MDEKIKLFCFPFSGGSAYSFNPYLDFVPEMMEFISLDYPGRGKRMSEPLLYNIDALVEDMFNSIKDQLNNSYAFYGHSMGTLIAFLLAKKIAQTHFPMPVHLFMTGGAAPSIPESKIRSSLPKDEFIEELKTIGGSPESMLNNDQVIDFFEPILRADFKCIETYKYSFTGKLKIPISVLIGDKEDIRMEQAQAWDKETLLPVEVKVMPGDHFFIYQHSKKIMDFIKKTLLTPVKSRHNV